MTRFDRLPVDELLGRSIEDLRGLVHELEAEPRTPDRDRLLAFVRRHLRDRERRLRAARPDEGAA